MDKQDIESYNTIILAQKCAEYIKESICVDVNSEKCSDQTLAFFNYADDTGIINNVLEKCNVHPKHRYLCIIRALDPHIDDFKKLGH